MSLLIDSANWLNNVAEQMEDEGLDRENNSRHLRAGASAILNSIPKPIETAPTDGTEIIAMLYDEKCVFRWASRACYCRPRGEKKENWFDGMNERLYPPTHWIEIPVIKG